MYAAFLSIIFTFVLYIPRKLITFRAFMKEMKEGMKSMIDTLIILVLAWTIGGLGGSLLRTGEYVGNLIAKSSIPLWIVSVVVFVV